MLISVVIKHAVMTGDGHNHSTLWHNLQLTVRSDGEVDSEVRIAVREVISRKVHQVNTFRCTSSHSPVVVGNIGDIVAAVVGDSREARHLLFRTIGSHHSGATRDGHIDVQRSDGQRILLIHHIVVALRCFARRRDDILAHILALNTTQAVANHVRGIVKQQTAHRSRQRRIEVAIHFRLGICRHRCRCWGDGQETCSVSHGVVALNSLTGRRNGVSTHIFASLTTERVGDETLRLTSKQTCHRAGESRIVFAIDLRSGIRSHRNSCRSDGQRTLAQSGIIVASHIICTAHHRNVAYRVVSRADVGDRTRRRGSQHIAVRQSHSIAGSNIFANHCLSKLHLVRGRFVCRSVIRPLAVTSSNGQHGRVRSNDNFPTNRTTRYHIFNLQDMTTVCHMRHTVLFILKSAIDISVIQVCFVNHCSGNRIINTTVIICSKATCINTVNIHNHITLDGIDV